MSRKSGYRFSGKDMRKQAHVPEKWIPVFRQGHAQTIKNLERNPPQSNRDAL
jgi:hypothetical protein